MQIVRTEAAGTKRAGPSLLRISFWLWAGAAALFVLPAYSTYKIRESEAEIYFLTHQMSGMPQERDEAEIELLEAKREAIILTDPASVKISRPKESSTPSHVALSNRSAASVNLAYLLP